MTTTCKIHNIRFYKLEPKGINCLSYNKNRQKIALSRSDGSIEIWNLKNSPFIEKTLLNDDGSVEALCWCRDRLFSVGVRGELIEYDLLKLKTHRNLPLTGDAGWCMAPHSSSNQLLIGTELGYINLIKLTNDLDNWDVKLFDKQDGRVLCIAIDNEGHWAATGSTDTVRIWNVETGHAVHRLNVGRAHTNQETLVWSVSILDDLTVISGDSRGCITFWDGRIGSQLENHETHAAAVLTVCVSDDQKTVYCAGIDPSIVSYERVKRPAVSGTVTIDKWVRSVHRKVHEHDVRSLIVIDNSIYSAGVDGYLVCSIYPPKTVTKYPPILQTPSVCVADDVRLVLLRYRNYLEVWKLGKEVSDGSSTSTGLQLEDEPVKLLTLQASESHGNIISSSISSDGRWIIYSTLKGVRLFNFLHMDENDPQLSNISSIPSQLTSCIKAVFTKDNSKLITVSCENEIQICCISGEQIFLSATINALENGLKDTIHLLIISTCGRYIVAADVLSNIVCWRMKSDNNWVKQCALPRYKSSPTAINIQPDTNNLLAVYSDQKIVEYNLKQKQFTMFSRSLDEQLPRKWLNRSFPILNITYDERAENIIMLHDDSNIYVIDKNKKLPKADAKIPKIDSASLSSQDDSRDSKDSSARNNEHAFHIVKRNKHLVYFGVMSDGEIVSVEVNPLSLFESLPPCLEKKKFGTK